MHRALVEKKKLKVPLKIEKQRIWLVNKPPDIFEDPESPPPLHPR